MTILALAAALAADAVRTPVFFSGGGRLSCRSRCQRRLGWRGGRRWSDCRGLRGLDRGFRRRRVEHLEGCRRKCRCYGSLHPECGTPVVAFDLGLIDGALCKVSTRRPGLLRGCDLCFNGRGWGFGRRRTRLLHQSRLRVGPVADLGIEAIRHRLQHGRVALCPRSPFGRHVGKVDGAGERLLPRREDAPVPDVARALGDRVVDGTAGIQKQMLKVRAHARAYVGEALAPLALPCRSKPGKIVLRRLDVAVTISAPIAEGAGLDDHLVKGEIPAHPEHFAVAHVFGGDGVVARIQLGIAEPQIGRQPARCYAFRYLVSWPRQNVRKFGCSRTCRQHRSGEGQKRKRSCFAKHGIPTRFSVCSVHVQAHPFINPSLLKGR